MFFHQYKYRIKYFLKTPVLLFWALLFPIILGTLFNMTFGSSIESQEGFSTIPIAVVIDKPSTNNDLFLEATKSVSYSEDHLMFDVVETSMENSKDLLKSGSITAIIFVGEGRELIVKENGFDQSIVKSFMDQYLRTEAILTDIATNRPNQLAAASNELLKTEGFIKQVNLKGEDTSAILQYFYALIAMVCLYGCFLGASNAYDIQANQSDIAARRCITPTNKLTLIVADNLAALTMHFIELVIVWFYLRFILGVPIGTQPRFFFLVALIGSMVGISIGQFVGVVVKGNVNIKMGILSSVSMIFSFFSGLMYAQMKDVVEKNFPLFNRINPAALITDAFYSLTVFDDYTRYYQSLISLVCITILLTLGSYMVMRRERYESI